MARDKIRLESVVFYGYHGVSAAERELGQRFVVDLEVERNLRPAGVSDDLQDTVDYRRLFQVAKELVEGPPRNLLESLAEAIARAVLERFPVEAVRVKISKPQVPIRGSILSAASVEIYRERDA